MNEREPICNLCGLTCQIGCEDHPASGAHGLINAEVSGGYESTAGNGHGALDDGTRYRFNLCEFCLDWLFEQFQVPVAVDDYMSGDIIEEAWRPALQRIKQDEWRSMKDEFIAEYSRRMVARKVK